MYMFDKMHHFYKHNKQTNKQTNKQANQRLTEHSLNSSHKRVYYLTTHVITSIYVGQYLIS